MFTDDLDLVVVGLGPAGLFATYYAQLRGLRTGVVDVLDRPGGQVAELLPDKNIYDVAGHPAIRGRDLISALTEQIGSWPTTSLLGHELVSIRRHGPSWILGTDQGESLRARAVVLCGGAGRFRPRTLPGADSFLGRGAGYACPTGVDLGHCVVVGGGDSAVDAALALEQVAASVTLVHRSSRFRAHEATVTQLERSSVQLRLGSEITGCNGRDRLESVVCLDRTGQHDVLPAQHLTIALGLITRPAPFTEWGITNEAGKIVVDSSMQTSQTGIFAAGDAVTYPGKVPLITSGFGEAATAVNNAAVIARHDLMLDPGHSSLRPPPDASAHPA
ncbi:NAD(P)/FAD-dependent oxidoreductase [Flexivirga sp. ID2601S]|uniref:Ferredoxin--NADP reductase n=1 Tax=Flexivirga aerilata TaxID=1656889 RepID=A0A849AF86_9MICO|nr:NAD(P)/FAD-dependent oxidoreductase [Flexivirga aerilata]NNG38493.1 NAD(P)/FAD-dependent oxidoreductase [Flexivirga aerilata]